MRRGWRLVGKSVDGARVTRNRSPLSKTVIARQNGERRFTKCRPERGPSSVETIGDTADVKSDGQPITKRKKEQKSEKGTRFPRAAQAASPIGEI